MMMNKNVKTDGNATLLKMQYGHHRITRSATHRRDSEDPGDRRLKSALLMRRTETSSNDIDDVKLSKKDSMSNFYSKNPQLSKAKRTASQSNIKGSVVNDSCGNLRNKNFGHRDSVEDVTECTFDPEEDYDFDAEGIKLED